MSNILSKITRHTNNNENVIHNKRKNGSIKKDLGMIELAYKEFKRAVINM